MAPRARFSTFRQASAAASALVRAVAMAGGPTILGERLGISSQAISKWTLCPPLRVLAVESASGVSRHELRPDLYPRPATGLTEAERALPAHLAAGAFFARTGRVLSAEGRA